MKIKILFIKFRITYQKKYFLIHKGKITLRNVTIYFYYPIIIKVFMKICRKPCKGTILRTE